MLSATKAVQKRSITSKLEVERKFVPTSFLTKHAADLSKTTNTFAAPTSNTASDLILTSLPRKRITDKYFDVKGEFERRGIWIRWRKEQLTKPDGTDAAPSEGTWEAKVKRGGDYLNSQFREVHGRDAVEELMAEAGVGDSIFDLRYELGFVADRVSWAIKDGSVEGKDGSSMTVVLDTITASLEGPNGDHPKYFTHQVGELELEKTVTTESSESKEHEEICTSEVQRMNKQLATFMSAHPDLFAGKGIPVGKVTAYTKYKEELSARAWKANEPGRIANMSEIKWEREVNGK